MQTLWLISTAPKYKKKLVIILFLLFPSPLLYLQCVYGLILVLMKANDILIFIAWFIVIWVLIYEKIIEKKERFNPDHHSW